MPMVTLTLTPVAGVDQALFKEDLLSRLVERPERLLDAAHYLLWCAFHRLYVAGVPGAMVPVDAPDADCGTMAIGPGCSVVLLETGEEPPVAVQTVLSVAEREGVRVVRASLLPL